MAQVFDLIVRNVTLVDGSGGPRVEGRTVAVSGSKIAIIAAELPAGSTARAELNGTGLVLAPGLVDVHTHDDNSLLQTPLMEFKTSQGVSTVVVGNCGISLAPFTMASGQAGHEATPPQNLLGEDFVHTSMKDFFGAVDAQPAAVNAAMLCGHTTLRIGAMGGEAAMEREANAEELVAMQEALQEALDAGAIGMSTGLAYASAASATTAEVIAMARLLVPAQAIYTTHLRNESESSEPAFLSTPPCKIYTVFI
jgi:N-acyl-D-amino-acid deacylase